MICALLVYQDPRLPEPLGRLSPWLDWTGIPVDEVYRRLAGQTNRRIIKTHTPLDGIVIDARVTYIVVGRHPLDSAVSLYHHSANIDRARQRELTGEAEPAVAAPPRPDLHRWLREWIDWDPDPHLYLDSIPGILWHATDAWERREQANVVLVHYEDLATDLEGSMRQLARRLGIEVESDLWPVLVGAATFAAMKNRAETTAPDPADILIDHGAFFRRGRSGEGREALSATELEAYRHRVATRAPPEVLAWLHHGD